MVKMKFKKCPFCDNDGTKEKLEITKDYDGYWFYFVLCWRCLARGPERFTAKKAGNSWNKRPWLIDMREEFHS